MPTTSPFVTSLFLKKRPVDLITAAHSTAVTRLQMNRCWIIYNYFLITDGGRLDSGGSSKTETSVSYVLFQGYKKNHCGLVWRFKCSFGPLLCVGLKENSHVTEQHEANEESCVENLETPTQRNCYKTTLSKEPSNHASNRSRTLFFTST